MWLLQYKVKRVIHYNRINSVKSSDIDLLQMGVKMKVLLWISLAMKGKILPMVGRYRKINNHLNFEGLTMEAAFSC